MRHDSAAPTPGGPLGLAELAERREALRGHLSSFAVLATREGRLLDAVDVPGWCGVTEVADVAEGHVAEHLHPDDVPVLLSAMANALRHRGSTQQVDVRLAHADGGFVESETTVTDAMDDPLLRGLVLTMRPRAESEPGDLTARAPGTTPVGSRFLSLADALPHGILSADGFGTVVSANRVAEDLLGRSRAELLGSGWEQAVHPAQRPAVVDALALVLDVGTRQHVEFRVAGVEERWVGALFVHLGEPGQPAGWLATLDDITDRRRTRVRLTHQATHDHLTRLPNRTLLHDRLRLAGARLGRTPHHGLVGVLFIDLDGFKAVNDTYGHVAGDQVLAELGRRLAETVRDTDLVARFGGDEFVVVCEVSSVEELDPLMARIHAAVTAPIEVAASPVAVGATIGLATTAVPLDDMSDLLAQADQAMYQAKRRP